MSAIIEHTKQVNYFYSAIIEHTKQVIYLEDEDVAGLIDGG